MGRVKRYFSPELKLEAVQRYAAGERLKELGEAYGVRSTLVHQWVMFHRRHGRCSLGGPGRPSREALAASLLSPEKEVVEARDPLSLAQQRIALLERKIGQQGLEIDFFKHALRYFETPLQPAERPGATAPTPSSGRKRSRKAD